MNTEVTKAEQSEAGPGVPDVIPSACGVCRHFEATGLIDRFKGQCAFYGEPVYKNSECIAVQRGFAPTVLPDKPREETSLRHYRSLCLWLMAVAAVGFLYGVSVASRTLGAGIVIAVSSALFFVVFLVSLRVIAILSQLRGELARLTERER